MRVFIESSGQIIRTERTKLFLLSLSSGLVLSSGGWWCGGAEEDEMML